MGEVAERSEDGEGIIGCKTLSVTYGDSSPKGQAKGVYAFWREKWSVSVPIRSIRCFMTAHQSGGAILFKNFFERENKSSGCFTLEKIRDTIHFTIQIVEGESL